MSSFPTPTESKGAASPAFTLSEAANRGILWKTPLLQNIPGKLLLSFIKLDNLLTGQQKIDLCLIKSSFQIYQLSFLNKKVIEGFAYILN